jgi:SAM-dependent methyltransferase
MADRFLRLPELKGYQGTDFDDVQVAIKEREIFAKKAILEIIYREYTLPFVESANRASPCAKMLELGAGTSPLKQKIPSLICSDIICLPWLDLSCSAFSLPFRSASLDRIFAMFALHHFAKIEAFLDEARRCLKSGGEIIIIDPAITAFSKFYYRFHVDRIDTSAGPWGFDGTGRLSDSNIASAWIVFFRDRDRLSSLYPEFEIQAVRYSTCLSFLLSGGLRIRQLLPTAAIRLLFNLENWLIRHVTTQIAVTMALTIRRR